jgi:hypothetical protein
MKRILFISIVVFFTAHMAQAADALFLLQDACVKCHLTSESPGSGSSVISWKKGVHFGPDTGCAECHGGNKFLYMAFKKGHMGTPKGREANEMCGRCHVNEIKEMNARSQFRSRSDKRCEATCVTCHSHHQVEKATLSIINSGNCGTCHPFEKAATLTQALRDFQDIITTLEGMVQERTARHLPSIMAEREIKAAQTALKRGVHAMTSSELIEHIQGKLIPTLSELKGDLSQTGQRNWIFQGVMVILFLFLCLIFVKYYQRRHHA